MLGDHSAFIVASFVHRINKSPELLQLLEDLGVVLVILHFVSK